MSSYLAVIGECLVDVVQSETSAPKAHVGGSPFNVAVGLARLQHDVLFCGRYGDDDYGRMIARNLRAQGVTSLLAADELPTSVARAILDPTGQASYEFSLDWELPSADEIAAAVHSRLVEKSDNDDASQLLHLHAGSIGAMVQPGAATVKELLERARQCASISYDPNYRPTVVPDREEARAQVEQFVAAADIIQASTDDLDLLYPERSHRKTMDTWLSMGPALVTVTRGVSGSMAVAASGFTEQEVFPVEVADTVGAGDSFMAATLSALAERDLLGARRREALHAISTEELTAVLRTATQAASITSSRFGAQPPTVEELSAALQV